MRTHSLTADDLDALQLKIESRDVELGEIERHLRNLANLARLAADPDGAPRPMSLSDLSATFDNIAGQIGTVAHGLQAITGQLMKANPGAPRTIAQEECEA